MFIAFVKRRSVRSTSTSLAHMVVETIARGTWKSLAHMVVETIARGTWKSSRHKDYESFEKIPAVLFKVSEAKRGEGQQDIIRAEAHDV